MSETSRREFIAGVTKLAGVSAAVTVAGADDGHPGELREFDWRHGARQLAAKMSQAWIQFARTWNPNHSGLPLWPSVSASTLPTMIFGSRCEVRNDPDKEERASLVGQASA
jgi:carboxylesterase type B